MSIELVIVGGSLVVAGVMMMFVSHKIRKNKTIPIVEYPNTYTQMEQRRAAQTYNPPVYNNPAYTATPPQPTGYYDWPNSYVAPGHRNSGAGQMVGAAVVGAGVGILAAEAVEMMTTGEKNRSDSYEVPSYTRSVDNDSSRQDYVDSGSWDTSSTTDSGSSWNC